MIVTRVPLRVSLFGGGTDLPEFYSRKDGRVLSFAINKYIYVVSHPDFQNRIRLAYSEVENVSDAKEIKHRLFKAVLQSTGVSRGLEIGTFADIPSTGSGLGSSSAFTVGLLANLSQHLGQEYDQETYAKMAFKIEREILDDPVGKQDHYGTAIGGVKVLNFQNEGGVCVSKLPNQSQIGELIRDCFKLVYTGENRNALPILKTQQENLRMKEKTFRDLTELLPLVDEGTAAMMKLDIGLVGQLLNQNWDIKKNVHELVSNDAIDSLYQDLLREGILGCKLLGAGGGGFFIGVAPLNTWSEITIRRPDLRIIDISMDSVGVKNLEI